LAGDIETLAGAVVPVTESEVVAVPPVLQTRLTVAAFAPALCGVEDTVTVQLAPPASVPPQVEPKAAKSAASAPASAGAEHPDADDSPELVNVTSCVPLEEKSWTLPKL
jgi:hypothetical protein